MKLQTFILAFVILGAISKYNQVNYLKSQTSKDTQLISREYWALVNNDIILEERYLGKRSRPFLLTAKISNFLGPVSPKNERLHPKPEMVWPIKNAQTLSF
ncbi:hypothetical protein IT402_01745 [Candidatus Nomurabacteria bacterium]|nr:hypothetical protein [Candidatus Nomurabacteria bacterium]